MFGRKDRQNISSWSELTPKLRWKDGVLQQARSVTHYEKNKQVSQEFEWHDVPQADGE